MLPRRPSPRRRRRERGAAGCRGLAPRRLPAAASPRGARGELRPGRGPAAAGAGALRERAAAGLTESPRRGPVPPSPPVRGEVPLARSRAHPTRPNKPGLRGGMPRLVQTPSPRLSPAASAVSSSSVTRAATPLLPALPIPHFSSLDLSRLCRRPSPPQSLARTPSGSTGKGQAQNLCIFPGHCTRVRSRTRGVHWAGGTERRTPNRCDCELTGTPCVTETRTSTWPVETNSRVSQTRGPT